MLEGKEKVLGTRWERIVNCELGPFSHACCEELVSVGPCLQSREESLLFLEKVSQYKSKIQTSNFSNLESFDMRSGTTCIYTKPGTG